MDTNKKDNFIVQNVVLSKGKTSLESSKRAKIKKALFAIAVVAITTGAYAQTNEQNSTKSQDIKNKNTLDKNINQNSDGYNHPDGYMMQNGKIVMIKNGKITPVDKDVTLSNGTMIMKNGSYIKKGGSEIKFKEGEHMDMTGNMIPMDKFKDFKKSEPGKSLKKDTMYLINDSTKNKTRKK
ncbi:MAG: hypothetical protein K0M40_12950 [Prolixibacteraceae bacterium]|nr:hypothetical protein [Prolixibacteraceae bacterium]